MSSSRSSIPRVAILLESSHHVSREMILGVMDYVHESSDWDISLIQGGPSDLGAAVAKGAQVDAVIARLSDVALARRLEALHVPTVLIDPEPETRPEGSFLATCDAISCDNAAIGRLAANFYLDRHYTSFAFAGRKKELAWGIQRRTAFVQTVKSAGFPVKELVASAPDLEAALAELPRQTALFAVTDEDAREVLNRATGCVISVPDDLSVLGVDNDLFVVGTTHPELSSISREDRTAGRIAAELLDKRLRDPAAPRVETTFAPVSVMERGSTMLAAAKNATVATALATIAKRGGDLGLTVAEVAATLGVTARTLERHFHAEGLNIATLLRDRRTRVLRRLVTDTDLPFAEIARRCGYSDLSHCAYTFKKAFGETMTEARHGTPMRRRVATSQESVGHSSL